MGEWQRPPRLQGTEGRKCQPNERPAELLATLPCPGFILASGCNSGAEETGRRSQDGASAQEQQEEEGASGGVCAWPGDAAWQPGGRGGPPCLAFSPGITCGLVSKSQLGLPLFRLGRKPSLPTQGNRERPRHPLALEPPKPLPQGLPSPPEERNLPRCPPRAWQPCSALWGFT